MIPDTSFIFLMITFISAFLEEKNCLFSTLLSTLCLSSFSWIRLLLLVTIYTSVVILNVIFQIFNVLLNWTSLSQM